MNDVPDNELLSAYLDGELTAEQQADVERLLAENPAAQQLLDDLRALSSTLQEMPRHTVPEDLSQQVLRRAERKILTEPPTAAIEPARPILRRLMNPRVWAYPALIVAVALIFMVFLEPPEDGNVLHEVAKAPDSGMELATEPAFDVAGSDVEEELAAEEPEDALVVERGMKAAADLRIVEGEAIEESIADAPAAPQRPAVAAPESAPADREAPAVAKGAGTITPKGAEKRALRSKAAATDALVTESEAKEKAPTAAPGKGGAIRMGGRAFAEWSPAKKDGSSEYGRDLASSADRVIVVNVRGKQPRRETLTRLFADAGIDWERAEGGQVMVGRTMTLARDALERVDRLGSVRPKQQDLQQNRSPLRPDARLVWVEATPVQIDAVIKGLRARADGDDGRIVSVSIEEATDADRVELNERRAETQTEVRNRQSKLADDVTQAEPAEDEPAGQQPAGESLGRSRGRAWFYYFDKVPEVAQTLEELDAAQPSEPAEAEERSTAADGVQVRGEKLELQQQVPLRLGAQATLQRALFVLRVIEPEPPAAARQAAETPEE